MQASQYLPIIVIFVVLYILYSRRKAVVAKKTIQKRSSEDNAKMIELAKRFIGKECLISAFDSSHQFDGVVKEVSDNAILIEKNEKLEAINLDFVIRIREYPKNKKGKKKSLVMD